MGLWSQNVFAPLPKAGPNLTEPPCFSLPGPLGRKRMSILLLRRMWGGGQGKGFKARWFCPGQSESPRQGEAPGRHGPGRGVRTAAPAGLCSVLTGTCLPLPVLAGARFCPSRPEEVSAGRGGGPWFLPVTPHAGNAVPGVCTQWLIKELTQRGTRSPYLTTSEACPRR